MSANGSWVEAVDLFRVQMELGPESGIARRGAGYVVYYGGIRADASTLADAIEIMRERITAASAKTFAGIMA